MTRRFPFLKSFFEVVDVLKTPTHGHRASINSPSLQTTAVNYEWLATLCYSCKSHFVEFTVSPEPNHQEFSTWDMLLVPGLGNINKGNILIVQRFGLFASIVVAPSTLILDALPSLPI